MTKWEYMTHTYHVMRYSDAWGLDEVALATMQRMGSGGWELVSMNIAPMVTGGGGDGRGSTIGGTGSMSTNPIWVDVGYFVALAVYKKPIS